jgi:hypothetical protein
MTVVRPKNLATTSAALLSIISLVMGLYAQIDQRETQKGMEI